MAITVYTLKKPEVTVTLTAGGTLAANTTYYLFAFFRNRIYSGYHDCGNSPFSSVVSFTTTDINKSVSVYVKATYNITGFENVSTGVMRVLSAEHNLATGNEIVIESGIYAGTYTITRENYNSFTIPATYSTTYASTFRCENFNYSKYGFGLGGYSCTSVVLYMHTVNPDVGTLVYNFVTGKFSAAYYSGGYSSNNISITAIFNVANGYAVHYNSSYNNLTVPSWCKVKELGQPMIYIDAPCTVNDLGQACIDAKITDRIYVVNDEMVAYGSIFLKGTSLQSIITFTGFKVKLLLSTIWGYYRPNVTFEKCQVSINYIGWKAYMPAIANNCQFLLCNIEQFPLGTNNSYILTSAVADYLVNGFLDTAKFYGSVLLDYVLTFGYAGQYINNIEFVNCRINMDLSLITTNRLIRNTSISVQSGQDIMLGPRTNMAQADMYVENIDTTRVNNEKSVIFAGNSYYTNNRVNRLNFMRTGTITVIDILGTIIVNATVNIIDNALNSYTGVTSALGKYNVDVKEQVSTTTMDAQHVMVNNVYTNFKITVSKAGYETYTTILSTMPKKLDMMITLKPSLPNRFTIEGKPLRALSPEMGSSSNLLEL